MTASENDTNENGPSTNNRFVVDISGEMKVHCKACNELCACTALPMFSIYSCENPKCRNSFKLRYYKGGKFELVDAYAPIKDSPFQKSICVLREGQKKFVLTGQAEPVRIYVLHEHKKSVFRD